MQCCWLAIYKIGDEGEQARSSRGTDEEEEQRKPPCIGWSRQQRKAPATGWSSLPPRAGWRRSAAEWRRLGLETSRAEPGSARLVSSPTYALGSPFGSMVLRTEIIPTTTLLTQESNGRSREEPWSPSSDPLSLV